MNNEYHRILISATSKKEAERIVENLLEDNLIAGCFMTSGESRHWWNGKIDREDYYSISAFTVLKNKDKIIKVVENMSKDEIPGIVFFKIDHGNKKFLNWISENTKNNL